MLETEAPVMYGDVSENVNCLENRICDLENCVVRRYSPGKETHGYNNLLLVSMFHHLCSDDVEVSELHFISMSH
jgi:hypothetical protein